MIMCLLVNQCLFSVSTLSLCLIQKLLQVKNAVNILLRFTQINSGCFDFFFFFFPLTDVIDAELFS